MEKLRPILTGSIVFGSICFGWHLRGEEASYTSSLDASQRIENVSEATPTYNQYCASCHGFSGKGDGPAAAAVNPAPRNFSDTNWQNGASDERIKAVISEGGAATGLSSYMPAWKEILNEKQIELVTLKVRSFGKLLEKPAPVHSAAEAYQQYCALCHGSVGNGEGPALKDSKISARNFTDAKWQSETSDSRIREVIREGGAAHGLDNTMPGFGSSLDPQIEGLIKIVRDFSSKPVSTRKN